MKKPNLRAVRMLCVCKNPECHTEFYKKEYDISLGRGKYCCRKCKDLHQKTEYLSEKNPMSGKKHSIKRKKELSDMMINMWKTNEHRKKVKIGMEKFIKENGHFPGADEESCLKRSTTLKSLHKDPTWTSEHITKRENTCIERYGKHSWEIALDSMNGKESKIEVIVADLLMKNNINFKHPYKIVYDTENMKFKEYDFYIEELNLLIEIDGDYWHANPAFYCNLNTTQIKNFNNDIFKNELAKIMGYKLIRFWETDVKNNNFEKILLKEIHG